MTILVSFLWLWEKSQDRRQCKGKGLHLPGYTHHGRGVEADEPEAAAHSPSQERRAMGPHAL